MKIRACGVRDDGVVRSRQPAPGIVTGQRVANAKIERAKQLRSAMTPEETMLWQRLRRNQLDGLHFRRQQVIAGFIADFYCHAARLVVEIDGDIHETRRSYDDARDNILESRGLRVLRIPAERVRTDLGRALRAIGDATRRGSPSL